MLLVVKRAETSDRDCWGRWGLPGAGDVLTLDPGAPAGPAPRFLNKVFCAFFCTEPRPGPGLTGLDSQAGWTSVGLQRRH